MLKNVKRYFSDNLIQGCPYSTDPSGNSITFDRDARSLNDIPRLKRQSKNGTVNKQNCRIYATEDPQEIQEVPLHDEKVTVWCGVSAKTVIGPFFFHDDQFCDANYSSKAYATVLVSTRRRSTAHKLHNNRFSEEIVSGPFDVEKW